MLLMDVDCEDTGLDNVEPEKDEVAAKIKNDAEQVKDALLGYAKVNILDTNLTFGKYNTRPLEQTEVTNMLKSMKLGMERYVPKFLISVVVDPTTIVASSLTLDPGVGGDEFREVEWVGGVLRGRWVAGGGRHREAAR